MRDRQHRQRNKKRGAIFQSRDYRVAPQRCNRCSQPKRTAFVERYGVWLCKLCAFEMDAQTKQPTGPGTYRR